MNRVTKKDLYAAVAEYNNRFCKHTKNELMVSGAYGGYGINLTGKRDKRYKSPKWRKGSLRSGQTNITYGYDSARNVLTALHNEARSGNLKRKISYWERWR